MKEALKLAQKAASQGEVPVGAVIVDPKENKIIARAYNSCETLANPLKHAEMIAIDKACKKVGSKNLKGYHLYVTLEPCAMCATAISYARLSRVYYGATDKKFGAIESGVRIYSTAALYKPEIYSDILAQESQDLLKEFFQFLRKDL
jgi:tRNA(adenine34) deaminase